MCNEKNIVKNTNNPVKAGTAAGDSTCMTSFANCFRFAVSNTISGIGRSSSWLSSSSGVSSADTGRDWSSEELIKNKKNSEIKGCQGNGDTSLEFNSIQMKYPRLPGTLL